jgi:acid stress-induced BolA-like protein IbaG/YrbA
MPGVGVFAQLCHAGQWLQDAVLTFIFESCFSYSISREFIMVTPELVQQYIEKGLQCEALKVTGDGQHFEALIVSAQFEGRSRVQRHQLVYAALGDRMREEIHALSMRTLTPQEAQATGQSGA